MKVFAVQEGDLSLIDIPGSTTYMFWFCRCNLRCPWCNNWLIADGKSPPCKYIDLGWFLERIEAVSKMCDYIMVTGGEPLLQADALRAIFERAYELGLMTAVNTNCTLPTQLYRITDVLDYVATDLKPPWALGVQLNYLDRFIRCLMHAADCGATVEVRIPVFKTIDVNWVVSTLDRVRRVLEHTEFFITIHPVIHTSSVKVRDAGWCSVHCNPSKLVIDEVALALKQHGYNVRVTRYYGIGG